MFVYDVFDMEEQRNTDKGTLQMNGYECHISLKVGLSRQPVCWVTGHELWPIADPDQMWMMLWLAGTKHLKQMCCHLNTNNGVTIYLCLVLSLP